MSHLKMHYSSTQTINSAHTNGYFLDMRSKKSLREEDLQLSSQPRHPILLLMQISDAISREVRDTYLVGGKNKGRKILRHRIVGQAEQNISGVTLWTTRVPFITVISLLCSTCRDMPRLLCDSARLTCVCDLPNLRSK